MVEYEIKISKYVGDMSSLGPNMAIFHNIERDSSIICWTHSAITSFTTWLSSCTL